MPKLVELLRRVVGISALNAELQRILARRSGEANGWS